MVSSVVDQLPGRPRLLAWMCTGWGSFSSSTAWATDSDDLPRRHAEVVDQRVDVVDVSRRLRLPDLDAAGIDELGGVRLCRAQQPPDQGLDLLLLSLLDRPHQVLVVAHQDIEAFIDARRIVEFLVGMTGRKRGNRGVEGRCIPHPRVLVAGGERTGHVPHRAAVCDLGAVDVLAPAFLLGAHLARGVDLGPDDMAVHIDAAGHDDQPPGIDHAGGLEIGIRRR